MIWRVGQRQGRYDKVFALLIIIIIIGIIQDLLFTYLDKEFFPHKFQGKIKEKTKLKKETTIFDSVINYCKTVLAWIPIGLYMLLLINEFTPIVSDTKILSHLFGGTTNVVHLIMISILIYKISRLLKKDNNKPQEDG